MTTTDRLGLPLLAAGQAQKEISHNEALALLDLLVCANVESLDLDAPPASPAAGQCWIVAAGASGAWAGQQGAIAAWSGGGWQFLPPKEGHIAWAVDRDSMVRFDGSYWQELPARGDGFYVAGERVAGARQGAIADPAGGSTQDNEARSAIYAILAAMRTHGLIDS